MRCLIIIKTYIYVPKVYSGQTQTIEEDSIHSRWSILHNSSQHIR